MIYTYDSSRLSKARTTIMGVAMMLVMLFHPSFPVDNICGLRIFKLSGDIGVDIFLMMSGMGIYCSLKRHPSNKGFRARRYKRILPAFLLVTSLWFFLLDIVLGKLAVLQFIYDVTTLSFWIGGNLTTWYLSSAMLLYLMTPFFMKLWKKMPKLNGICIVAFFVAAVLIRMTSLNNIFGHLLIVICRIPAYLAALSLGRRMEEEPKIRICLPVSGIVVAACIAIVVIALGATSLYLPFAFKYFAYFPVAMLCHSFLRIARVLLWAVQYGNLLAARKNLMGAWSLMSQGQHRRMAL